MVTWYPDFCPTGQCMIELVKVFLDGKPVSVNWTIPNRLITLCAHHQNVKNANALDDTGVFTAILRSCQSKEKARWALKLDFMANGTIDDDYVSETNPTGVIDKEWPGAKFKADPSGDILIESGTLHIPSQARQRLSKLVDDESKKIEQVPGISRILLE